MSLYVEIMRHLTQLFRKTLISVDLIIKGTEDGSIVLVKRAFEPYKGYWALPGGFLEHDQTIEFTALKESREETGLDIRVERLIDVYSYPGRDPRGHVVSVCMLTREVGGELKAGSDAEEASRFKEFPSELAFDHGQMLRDAGYLTPRI